jgi:hypothetical protein
MAGGLGGRCIKIAKLYAIKLAGDAERRGESQQTIQKPRIESLPLVKFPESHVTTVRQLM